MGGRGLLAHSRKARSSSDTGLLHINWDLKGGLKSNLSRKKREKDADRIQIPPEDYSPKPENVLLFKTAQEWETINNLETMVVLNRL